MNKIIKGFTLVALLLIASSSFSQTALSSSEASILKEKVIKKSKTTKSIKSDFEQFKHLSFLTNDIKSTGKLTFKTPDLIKWEYEKPFVYKVVFKESKLFIDDDGKKSQIDLSSNKTFKSMNSLIVKSVKGDMFDEDQFEISYFKSGENYLVKFKPKDKNLKEMISQFDIIFEKNSLNVLEIKMIESSEDYTRIVFINQKINVSVSDAEFTL